MINPKNSNTTRLIGIEPVLDQIGVSRATSYRGLDSGIFPRPIKVGNRSLWPEPEIEAVVQRLIGEAKARAEARAEDNTP